MGLEYRICWTAPQGYDPRRMLEKLPSPISSYTEEIYTYSIEDFGFYFIDHLVDTTVASTAFRVFLDEALRYSDSVTIDEP